MKNNSRYNTDIKYIRKKFLKHDKSLLINMIHSLRCEYNDKDVSLKFQENIIDKMCGGIEAQIDYMLMHSNDIDKIIYGCNMIKTIIDKYK